MYQHIPVINGYPKGKTTRSFTLFSLQCLFYFSFSVNICTVFIGLSHISLFFYIYITDISRHPLLIRSTWMHPCVVGVRVAHICFSFFLFVSSRSLCYFCSAAWLRYLIYDFLFIPQFFLPFLIIIVHFSLFFYF
jgi:hypothetical protein